MLGWETLRFLSALTATRYRYPIADLDGLGSNQQGGQLLSDCRRLERATTPIETSQEAEAGIKLSRRVLTCCWDSMLTVLSSLLGGVGGAGSRAPSRTAVALALLGTDGPRDDSRRYREAVVACLEGLQRAARLANILGTSSPPSIHHLLSVPF